MKAWTQTCLCWRSLLLSCGSSGRKSERQTNMETTRKVELSVMLYCWTHTVSNTYNNNGANANWSFAGKWFWMITNINDFLKRCTWNLDWLHFFLIYRFIPIMDRSGGNQEFYAKVKSKYINILAVRII